MTGNSNWAGVRFRDRHCLCQLPELLRTASFLDDIQNLGGTLETAHRLDRLGDLLDLFQGEFALACRLFHGNWRHCGCGDRWCYFGNCGFELMAALWASLGSRATDRISATWASLLARFQFLFHFRVSVVE